MPNFADDVFRKVFNQLGDKNIRRGGRVAKEVDRRFAEISAVMELYAEQSGGTFALSIDEQYRDAQWNKLPFPLSYFFPSAKLHNTDPSLQRVVDHIFEMASIHWQHNDLDIRFELRKAFLLIAITAEVVPGSFSRLQHMHSLSNQCRVKPKTTYSLQIQKRGLAPFLGSTGSESFSSASWMRSFYDKAFPEHHQTYEAGQATTTYFSPFGDDELQGRFTLRSTSVRIGQTFAKDATFTKLLFQLPGLACLSVGKLEGDKDDDFGVSVSANPNTSMEQFELMHRLMTRSLELLKSVCVI